MPKRIARIVAGLALATAATTGLIAATDIVATPQSDTAWGADAPDSPGDTAWGTPPADLTGTVNSAGDDVSTLITPLDTAWG